MPDREPPPSRKRVRRKKRGGEVGGLLVALLTMVLVFWNPRGIRNKEPIFKEYMGEKGAIYAGVSESQTYRSST